MVVWMWTEFGGPIIIDSQIPGKPVGATVRVQYSRDIVLRGSQQQ
jgi:hypothetical protein